MSSLKPKNYEQMYADLKQLICPDEECTHTEVYNRLIKALKENNNE